MMIYNNKEDAIKAMNDYGGRGLPFVFLIDFEMNKIIVSTDTRQSTELAYNMNGHNNDQSKKSPVSPDLDVSFFERYPISKEEYFKGFDLVKSEIQKGNSFLLNLTYPTKLVTNLTLDDIYNSTQAKYKIHLKDKFVCFSPEIFIKIQNEKISSYPMKGTIDADIENAEQIILDDAKETAEHYTIVDLIRNDLSKVAKKVTVDRFRFIETIQTSKKNLLQVSSEISGQLPMNYESKIGSIIFELLPAGSISGAPKVKTLEIIRTAEGSDRGYYSGICGVFDGKNLDSGVMIRYVEQVDEKLYYRSGCGITAMSDPNIEYQEMIDKVYLPTVMPESESHCLPI